jgi:predicted transposase/invertase (TIGR01784 family)
MVFIELPKFNKTLEDLVDIKEQWIYFIKNAGSLEYIPDNLPVAITSAFETSNTASLSAEELELQYKKQEFIAVQKSSLSTAERKGHEAGVAECLSQGLAQGLSEGEARGKLEVAKALILQKMPLDIIATATGISKDILAKLSS